MKKSQIEELRTFVCKRFQIIGMCIFQRIPSYRKGISPQQVESGKDVRTDGQMDKQTDDKNIELVRVPLQHASFLARNQWGGMSPEMKERKKKEESSTNNPDEV